MATNRTYNDLCGIARGLDIVGERWALLVVRELLLGPKRFTDLQADLVGVSTNVLSSRLEELEGSGVLCRRQLPRPAGSAVYELTPWGQQLEPIVCQLGRWSLAAPARPRGKHLSGTALALSLRTMFDAEAAAGLTARVDLELGYDRFRAEVAGGTFSIVRAAVAGGTVGAGNVDAGTVDAGTVDAVIRADPLTLVGVVYHGRDLDGPVRSGRLVIDGDRSTVECFVRLFRPADPAPSGAVPV